MGVVNIDHHSVCGLCTCPRDSGLCELVRSYRGTDIPEIRPDVGTIYFRKPVEWHQANETEPHVNNGSTRDGTHDQGLDVDHPV